LYSLDLAAASRRTRAASALASDIRNDSWARAETSTSHAPQISKARPAALHCTRVQSPNHRPILDISRHTVQKRAQYDKILDCPSKDVSV
jgi:hypothetical protein